MKIFSFLVALASVFSLSSCVELGSLITVNKDGSGTIEETVLLSAQLKAMVASMPPGAGDGAGAAGNPAAALSGLVPDKKKADENALKYGEGVTVKSVDEVTLPDGRGGAKVTYDFADITKVKYHPGKEEAEKEGVEQEPVTFGFSGGELTINIPQGKTGETIEKLDEEQLKKAQEIDPAQMAMMKPMFAGMRMSFAVKAASGIASTDAAHLDGDTVTIMDMQVDKLFDNPESFKKFAAMMEEQSEPDPKKLAEQFRGVEGIKVEEKEIISIKLK
ncbi:hypothetical protein FEM03_21640 [Phragmitibacter flavus]|uniref:Lipoprotein n=1 Tax=Phragmitibacter flavus TaxID=2576071 RepID=A0A5R8K8L1_9BACT|nr:hypothetical protein [Phragmitibacter flavus]TLD68646.1 hypothetical protein FEM03_21640 [Phragmitibacter flavus]